MSVMTASGFPNRPQKPCDIDLLIVCPQNVDSQAKASNESMDRASLIVLEADQAVEFVPLWQNGQIRKHDLLVGIVTRRMPQLGGVFVNIGASHDGLLRLSPSDPIPSEGSRVMVSVTREGQAGKGPVLSTHVTIPSCYAVLRPGQNPLRRSVLSSYDPDEAERLFQEDLSCLSVRFAELVNAAESGPAPRRLLATGDPLIVLLNAYLNRVRSIQTEGIERYHRVEQLLQETAPSLLPILRIHPSHRTYDLAAVHRQGDLGREVCQRQVRLHCGGTLFFDKTEALHVIDVNSGAAVGLDKNELAERVNREAIREIARQLRLRNLTGMIVIDLIHQKDPSMREPLAQLLRDELTGDRGRSTVYGFSALSLLELIRTAP
jgi:Ribonuclease G/E